MKEALVSQFSNFLAYVARTGIRNCKFISTWNHQFLLRDRLLCIAQTQAGSLRSLRNLLLLFHYLFVSINLHYKPTYLFLRIPIAPQIQFLFGDSAISRCPRMCFRYNPTCQQYFLISQIHVIYLKENPLQ